MTDSESDAILADWVERLTAELGLDAADVDVNGILGLAGTAAHAILRPAAPLTTFIVGYAAGLSVAERTSTPSEAFATAAAAASALAHSLEAQRPDESA
jgi:hypothetical protein